MQPDIYDIESYPNFFSICIKPLGEQGLFYEISDRRRDNAALHRRLSASRQMVGFNNMGYDYPMLDHFLRNPEIDAAGMYERSQAIISGDRFENTIWQPLIPQVDLYLIHHFNNRAKSTSLKKLQFNMRSRNVENSPIPFGQHLNYAEMDETLRYNAHDVLETEQFYIASKDKIALREAINPDWMNQSDTGLGRKYFERELEARGVSTRRWDDETGRKLPTGSPRPHGVQLGSVIFPYIHFDHPELRRALDIFRAVLVPTQDFDTELDIEGLSPGALSKKVFGVHAGAVWRSHSFELDGIEVTCGLGGIHASRDRKMILRDNHHAIVDLDVTSFYPNIAIKNRIFPAHLGPIFCDVYSELLARRLTAPKGSPENLALKLALNSVFGSAGSAYTCFYDPAWLLAITVNGQLLILKLAEWLLTVPGVRLIQLNTDGLTISVPHEHRERVAAVAAQWSASCLMPLETNEYNRMWIRDVNNYLAEYTDGKVKRKGAYQHDRDWHQNHSMPVVRMAAEAAMLRGTPPAQFIGGHPDPWDFMMRLDLTRASRLVLDDGTEHHGVVRYYVSPSGHSAIKHMPKTVTRIHGKGHADVEKMGTRSQGVRCTACDTFFPTKKAWMEHADEVHASKLRVCQEYNGEPIDYDMRYYEGEAKKLLITDRFYP